MNIALFGATGRTGAPLLTKALDGGHVVRVLVRSPEKLDKTNVNLDVVEGDLLDLEAVKRCIDGVDAVIFAAGPRKGSDPMLLEQAAENIISAMKSFDLKRLVWLSGAGVVDDRDSSSVSRHLIRGLMKLFAGRMLASSQRMYDRLIESNLHCTIVRAPMLSEKPGGGEVEFGYTPPKPKALSREDLAGLMLRFATSNEQLGESPMVGYRG